jgi:hypothetical protein
VSSLFHGHCKHYGSAPGGKLTCAKGVDIRAHVGGKNLGWRTRTPCVTSGPYHDSANAVPCAMLELPTAEEVAEAQAKFMRDVDAIMSGKCPACGATLVTRENTDVRVSACPCGQSSMRECKRIGERL